MKNVAREWAAAAGVRLTPWQERFLEAALTANPSLGFQVSMPAMRRAWATSWEAGWERRAAYDRWLAETKYVRIYRGSRRPYGRQRRARR